jgi:fluoride exporter
VVTVVVAVLTVVAGGTGCVLRVAVDAVITRRFSRWSDQRWPVGTLAVNLVGCWGLGLVTAAGVPVEVVSVATVGILGGFTTFSAWVMDLGLLAADRNWVMFGVVVSVSTVGGLLAVELGRVVGNL